MIYLYGLFLSIILSFISCAAPAAPQKPEAVPKEISSVKKGEPWQAEWERVLAGARKEGKVYWLNSGGSKVRLAIMEAFQKRFEGIGIDIVSGKSKELNQKTIAEQRVGLYLADVMQTRPTEIINTLLPAKVLAPLEPALIRPDILDSRYWKPGEPLWLDKEHHALAIETSISGKLAINTNLVEPGEITKMRDLLNPKWKGKINMIYPLITHETFFGAVGVRHGWDFWRELVNKQKPLVLRDQRLQIERVARGVDAISISAKTELIVEYARDIGAPVDKLILDDAAYVSGDAIVLLKNAPHPNAAKVFINWILSQEGQTVYHNAQGSGSARTDLTLKSSADVIPKPGVDYFNARDSNFILGQEERYKIEEEIFGPFLK